VTGTQNPNPGFRSTRNPEELSRKRVNDMSQNERQVGCSVQGFLRPLVLTNSPFLGGTGRILQSWLTLPENGGCLGPVVVQHHGDFANWLEQEGISHCIDPMPWPSRIWPFKCGWHAWKIARWARRMNVDLIHCNEHDLYPFALVLRRLLKVPMVCHVRFRITREFSEWAFGNGRAPDALLWTSKQQWHDCGAAVEGLVPRERQHLVYLGLDLNRFGTLESCRQETRGQWQVRPDEIVIASASAMKPIKRLEDFIRLVEQLAKRDSRVVGILAGSPVPGEDDYREKVVGQLRATGLGRRLQWVGKLEPVEHLYHACDVFVSTSEYETFGNSVCEAMACRRPVAAYRGGSVQELVGDTGILVENGNLDGLIAAVEQLMKDGKSREDLGTRARQRVAVHFNPMDSLRKLRQIYASIGTPARALA
jgi:glycosyltransferase involved in cell wall biosynthesis